jgi:sporulation protein YlmC with PRC-barrel domain
MKLSELLGCEVRATTGWTFGRVYDVRVSHGDGDASVLSLVVGTPGLKERLFGRGNPSEHPTRLGHGFEIPWSSVVRRDGETIIIKEGDA